MFMTAVQGIFSLMPHCSLAHEVGKLVGIDFERPFIVVDVTLVFELLELGGDRFACQAEQVGDVLLSKWDGDFGGVAFGVFFTEAFGEHIKHVDDLFAGFGLFGGGKFFGEFAELGGQVVGNVQQHIRIFGEEFEEFLLVDNVYFKGRERAIKEQGAVDGIEQPFVWYDVVFGAQPYVLLNAIDVDVVTLDKAGFDEEDITGTLVLNQQDLILVELAQWIFLDEFVELLHRLS